MIRNYKHEKHISNFSNKSKNSIFYIILIALPYQNARLAWSYHSFCQCHCKGLANEHECKMGKMGMKFSMQNSPIAEEEEEEIAILYLIYSWLLLPVCILGIIGNTMSVIVLSRVAKWLRNILANNILILQIFQWEMVSIKVDFIQTNIWWNYAWLLNFSSKWPRSIKQ